MSYSIEWQTEFRNLRAQVATLIECGCRAAEIEVLPEALPWYGYRGDVRSQQARVIIHRQHVGWKRQADDTLKARISDCDAGVGGCKHGQDAARFSQANRRNLVKGLVPAATELPARDARADQGSWRCVSQDRSLRLHQILLKLWMRYK